MSRTVSSKALAALLEGYPIDDERKILKTLATLSTMPAHDLNIIEACIALLRAGNATPTAE